MQNPFLTALLVLAIIISTGIIVIKKQQEVDAFMPSIWMIFLKNSNR